MVGKKQQLGQFFTKKTLWLLPQVLDFIKNTGAKIAFDPFAGNGDMLNAAKEIGFKEIKGYDIDSRLNWERNDSLVMVPRVNNAIIITNPPYLTNYSAKRKGINGEVDKYFLGCSYDDLYQLALEKCFSNDFGVLIIPETFINSSFPKNRLVSITILEDNPFEDTETPVCVICFNNKNKNHEDIKVYKNEKFLNNLEYFEKLRRRPQGNLYIKFNSPKGQIALRAVDTTNPAKPISFMRKNMIDYDLTNIKESSRLITLIEICADEESIDKIINRGNDILLDFRNKTFDVLLSPFKGNKKNGERRRRLDYTTARAILEDAQYSTNNKITLKLI